MSARLYFMNKSYRIIVYYARSHQREFATKQAALNAIKARGLTCTTNHYTELWEDNGTDGEMIAIYENSNTELIPT